MSLQIWDVFGQISTLVAFQGETQQFLGLTRGWWPHSALIPQLIDHRLRGEEELGVEGVPMFLVFQTVRHKVGTDDVKMEL